MLSTDYNRCSQVIWRIWIIANWVHRTCKRWECVGRWIRAQELRRERDWMMVTGVLYSVEMRSGSHVVSRPSLTRIFSSFGSFLHFLFKPYGVILKLLVLLSDPALIREPLSNLRNTARSLCIGSVFWVNTIRNHTQLRISTLSVKHYLGVNDEMLLAQCHWERVCIADSKESRDSLKHPPLK